jgi:hypothetical protein
LAISFSPQDIRGYWVFPDSLPPFQEVQIEVRKSLDFEFNNPEIEFRIPLATAPSFDLGGTKARCSLVADF